MRTEHERRANNQRSRVRAHARKLDDIGLAKEIAVAKANTKAAFTKAADDERALRVLLAVRAERKETANA